MKKNVNSILNYLTLIVLGIYVNYLYLIQKITLLIHPRYIWLVLVAGVVITLVGIVGIIQIALQSINKNSKNQLTTQTTLRNSLFSGLLLVLTIGLFFVPIASLSIFSYNIRTLKSELSLNETDKANLKEKFKLNLNTRNFTIEDWVKAKSLNNLKLFENNEFVGVGFVASKTDKTFNLSRFVISCCIVDATPISLLVDYNSIPNDQKEKIVDGEWIEIVGKFQIQLVNNEQAPVIIPTSVTKTSEPKDTYINRN